MDVTFIVMIRDKDSYSYSEAPPCMGIPVNKKAASNLPTVGLLAL
jgi:hypothetical protein